MDDATGQEPTESSLVGELLRPALDSLTRPGMTIWEAQASVPPTPGLYAVHGDASVWRLLGLGDPPDERPLYAGKAERSLASRDVKTHFSTGKTGSSTLRRSLAGLLTESLQLHGQPRNLDSPDGSANFSLEPASDARLTVWMEDHLRLAVWAPPPGAPLDAVETAVLSELSPPLNLDKVVTPWREQVRVGRRRLAAEARAWNPPTAAVSTDDRSARGSGCGRVVGIDAAGPLGWLGVIVDSGGFVAAQVGTLAEVIGWAEPIDVIAIDIPIGNTPLGVRQADVEARAFVAARGSSVFSAPPLLALDAGSYAETNDALVAAGLKKLSQQSYALIPKIVEAAAVAAIDDRIVEVHPEVSFRELAGRELQWSKKSWNGLLLRRRLLKESGIALPDTITEVRSAVADDVVDAAAAAWSARRIAAGTARTIPAVPEEHDGRSVAIWC